MTKSFEQRGGCHCGALRYTVTMQPRWMHACHCTDCQRHTGSAFGLVVAVPEAGFHLTGTPKLVQRVLGSGKIRQRWNCPAWGLGSAMIRLLSMGTTSLRPRRHLR